jgi:murein DD-endopeptidase MepM/ murein hydrolase activator NlpD
MLYSYLVILAFCSWITGCATVPYVRPTPPPSIPGIYHRVVRGETLWRISKIYNVDLDEIININRIPDATTIETGQLIFIPHRQKPQYSLGKSIAAEDFIWPVRGRVVASFGQTFNNMINKGINIQTYGSPNVVASRSGKVVFYDDNFKDFGKTIIIDHGDGFSTVYARNSQVFIKIGDYVQRGTLIAKAGSTDRDKNTYLHFQIRKGYIPQNPYFYLSH